VGRTIGFVPVPVGCCLRKNKSRTNPEWDTFAQRYLAAYLAVRPDVAVVDGVSFDGRLPNFSSAALDREMGRLHSAQDRAERFQDDSLDGRQRFERDYLISSVDSDLFLAGVSPLALQRSLLL
jgi:hypothetical protein